MTSLLYRSGNFLWKPCVLIHLVLISTLLGCTKNKIPDYRGSKNWAHRANDVNRLEIAKNSFDGIELDLVIKEECLDIYHPPEESKGLCLSEYWKTLPIENKNAHFWLDVKNLEESNVQLLIDHVSKACNENQIPLENLWIESTQHVLLPSIKASGFNVSYYLPSISDYPNKEDIAIKLKANAERSNLDVLSTDIKNYPYLKKDFPAYTKLLWALGPKAKFSTEKEKLYNEAMQDSTVKVILVSF